eukprot:scaffold21267_cov32-Tisochrysis_lutea.AAC.6
MSKYVGNPHFYPTSRRDRLPPSPRMTPSPKQRPAPPSLEQGPKQCTRAEPSETEDKGTTGEAERGVSGGKSDAGAFLVWVVD